MSSKEKGDYRGRGGYRGHNRGETQRFTSGEY